MYGYDPASMLSDECPSQDVKIVNRSNIMCPKCPGKSAMQSRDLCPFRPQELCLDHGNKLGNTQPSPDLPPRYHMLNMIHRRRSRKFRHQCCSSRSLLTLNQHRCCLCFGTIHGQHKRPHKMRHNPYPAYICALRHAARGPLENATARSRGAASSREE